MLVATVCVCVCVCEYQVNVSEDKGVRRLAVSDGS